MSNSNDDLALRSTPEQAPITLEDYRRDVKLNIQQLADDVFKTLQRSGTNSILDYLIVTCIQPIEQAFRVTPLSVDEILKKIWPTEFTIFIHYLTENTINPSSYSTSITTLLQNDQKSHVIFERLLLFAEVIPEMEEKFHQQEWILLELKDELKARQRKGYFQRLQITLPSEQLKTPNTSRGDLDITVTASKPMIFAGEEFSVFVVINNPFDVPVTIYSVETQIPVELMDVYGFKKKKTIAQLEVENERKMKEQVTKPKSRLSNFTSTLISSIGIFGVLEEAINLINQSFLVRLKMAKWADDRIAQAVSASDDIVSGMNKPEIKFDIKMDVGENRGQVTGASIAKYQSLDLSIDSVSPHLLDRILWRWEGFKRGLTPITLQPGNSVVKQFIFKTKSWLLFSPLAHTMQIQVRYAVDDRDQLDTVSFALSIQAAITATMTGAIIGGAVGGIARLLSGVQENQNLSVPPSSQFLSVLLAIILSAVTVVSFARKSGVQQIVSIEDFWGGLFLGFLIGFFGQNYALNLLSPNGAGTAANTSL